MNDLINRGNTKGTIDEDDIAVVVAEMTEDSSDLFYQSIELHDAFNAPRLVYDEITKTYKVQLQQLLQIIIIISLLLLHRSTKRPTLSYLEGQMYVLRCLENDYY